MEITGILKMKFDTQKVSDRFSKREFVLTTEASTPYPQHISFQVTQDKCDLLDRFNEGDEIKVNFNLRGREWNGPQGVKYFNTLEAWRIELVGAGTTTNNHNHHAANAASFDDNDDLPF
jgi:hypothetical protein